MGRRAALALAISVVVTACGGQEAAAPAGTRPTAGATLPVAAGATATTATADPLAGALSVFFTLTPGKEISSVDAAGVRVTLETTRYHVVRATERADPLRIASESSQSFAHRYLYPITRDERLYLAHISTDTPRKELRTYDPRSGKAIATVCDFYSAGTYKGFAIVGDRVWLRTQIGRDLRGDRTSGGDLAYLDMPCTGSPKVVATFERLRQVGAFDVLSAGGRLYLEGGTEQTIDLWEVDTRTGAATPFATLKRAGIMGGIHEGDDALYYAAAGAGDLSIVRLPPEGRASVVARIPTLGTVSPSLSVDATGSEVYVGLSDPRPRLLLIGRDGTAVPLKIDASLFGTTMYGSGQIIRTR